MGLTGVPYAIGAGLLGVAFTALAVRFAWLRTPQSAKRLFFGSLAYLPLVWILMVVDRQ